MKEKFYGDSYGERFRKYEDTITELKAENDRLAKHILELQKDKGKLIDENNILIQENSCELCYKKSDEELKQAKGIIKELLGIINYLNEDEYGKEDFEIVHKAEQLIKE